IWAKTAVRLVTFGAERDTSRWLSRSVYRSNDRPTEDSELIQRARHGLAAAIEHVRVNHRRLHAGMAQQLLHRANVIPGLQQVRREGVSQGMRRGALADAGLEDRGAEGAGHRTFVQMPADLLDRVRVRTERRGREDELPAEIACCAGRLAVEGFG